MESQGAPLPEKQGQPPMMGQQAPPPGPPGTYYAGQAPPAYTTTGTPQYQNAPQVQYIVQNPPMANPPNDYFIQAILVTIFCFWPTGIIAIIKALDSRRAAQTGDIQNAQLSSQAARKMSLISLIIGIAILVVVAIIIVVEIVVVVNL